MTAAFRRVLLAVIGCIGCLQAVAQEGISKDGAVIFSIGAGYERMPDTYTPKGFALGTRCRFHLSERAFCELMAHWGHHEGRKHVMQKGEPFPIDDSRDCLLGAVGPGFDVFQSGNKVLCVHVKGLLGYGARADEYDGYQPVSADDGRITLGCEKNKKGIAAVIGAGLDWRFKRWTLTPYVDAIYVGGKIDIACMMSVGFLY